MFHVVPFLLTHMSQLLRDRIFIYVIQLNGIVTNQASYIFLFPVFFEHRNTINTAYSWYIARQLQIVGEMDSSTYLPELSVSGEMASSK